MIGLALEGGGVKGSYQAGVYLAFLECGIHIDGVCGTSIGAINGAIIASGKGAKLPSIWRNVKVGEIFGLSTDLVESINKKKFNLRIFIKNLIPIIKNRGIDLEGVRGLLDKYLNVEALYKSKMDFGLVTVRTHDLTPLYLWKEDIPKERMKDFIIASASLPIFKREKLDDSYYLDGGFYDNGPVNMLLNKGYKTIYLVKVQGIGLHRKYDKNADVRVIESKRKLGRIIELDPLKIQDNIKMGYYDAIRVLKNLDGEVYVFKNKSEDFYKYLNRKVNPRVLKRVKNFFHTDNLKDTTIKALEYLMELNHVYYYDIYDPRKVIKNLKRYKMNHFIYDYVKSLRYFF